MFDNLLLVAEGFDHSVHAAQVAGDLARTMKSSNVCILVAYPPVPAFLGEPNLEKVTSARMIEAEFVCKSLLGKVGQIPGKVQTEVLAGSVVESTLAISRAHGSDLIVMGAQAAGTLGHLVAGHHTEEVADHAPCPVLIVR